MEAVCVVYHTFMFLCRNYLVNKLNLQKLIAYSHQPVLSGTRGIHTFFYSSHKRN
jgi:hypothetical protein